MRKLLLLPVALLVALTTSASDNVTVTWTGLEEAFLANSISEDCKYVCGTGSIWNLETGDIVTSYHYENLRLSAVANTGLAVGNIDDYAASFDTNEVSDYIDGMNFQDFSTARSVSADGSIITGSRFDEAFHQIPGYWQNGEFHSLPLPEKYEDMPEDVEVYSVAAGGISADGSVIAGNIITGTGAEAFVMWIRNESGEYEFLPLYAGHMEFGWEDEKPYIYMSAQKISNNGEWISLVLQHNSFEDFGYYAGRYNVKTGEVECAGRLYDYTECDYYATGIANDGTVVGFLEQAQMMMYGRRSYIWMPGTSDLEEISDYYEATDDLDTIESSETTVYTDISGDGKHIVGFALNQDYVNAFVINLLEGTGVGNVAVEKKLSDGIYTLQGTKLTCTPDAGIYIVVDGGNTKKIIVR